MRSVETKLKFLENLHVRSYFILNLNFGKQIACLVLFDNSQKTKFHVLFFSSDYLMYTLSNALNKHRLLRLIHEAYVRLRKM